MKVLIFGGSGMLGSMMVKHLSENHDVTFTVRGSVPKWMPLPNKVSVVKFDVTDEFPKVANYDYVINCIGAIPQKTWADHEFYMLNSVFPWKLATACAFEGVKLIHISSDCVFSGESELPYQPTAISDIKGLHKNLYGATKSLGEPFGAIVIRTSIIGPAEDHSGLFEWFMNNNLPTVNGYTNHFWSGVTTLYLAQFVDGLISGGNNLIVPPTGGLIQIASLSISKHKLLEHINTVFGCGKTIVPSNYQARCNRALVPSVGYADNIKDQLEALKEWMKTHVSI